MRSSGLGRAGDRLRRAILSQQIAELPAGVTPKSYGQGLAAWIAILSFGSQSQGGSEFVSRMLTVSSSLKAQSRSVLDFTERAIVE